MIQKINVVNHKNELLEIDLFNPGASGMLFNNLEGVGGVDADIFTTDSVNIDGATFNGSRRKSRNITFDLIFVDSGGINIEQGRHLTYRFFPTGKWVSLEFITDERTSYIEGYVEKNEPEIFSELETTSVSIICPDPNFHDSNDDVHEDFSGIAPEFVFPFDSPPSKTITMGRIDTIRQKNIYYNGEIDTGFAFYFHFIADGVSNLKLYNLDTGGMLSIDDSLLPPSVGQFQQYDTLIVSTYDHNHSIMLLRGSVYTNCINAVNRDVEWFKLTKGDNTFAYTFDMVDANLIGIQAEVEYPLLYEGL